MRELEVRALGAGPVDHALNELAVVLVHEVKEAGVAGLELLGSTPNSSNISGDHMISSADRSHSQPATRATC